MWFRNASISVSRASELMIGMQEVLLFDVGSDQCGKSSDKATWRNSVDQTEGTGEILVQR